MSFRGITEMKKDRLGFTLVEVLIGAVLVTIVTAGISFGISAALKLYEKAESQSVVINGLRFTVDSYNREIVPILHDTKDISILEKPSDIPQRTSISDDVHYLYLKDGVLTVRTKSGDEALPGSDYITNLDFTIPKGTSKEGKNYLLDMKLTAKYSAHASGYDTDVVKSADIVTALYNIQSKDADSHKDGDNYSGTVLRFVSEPDVVSFNVVLENIHLRNASAAIVDYGDVANGTYVSVSYDLHTDPSVPYNLTDVSTYEWFITLDPTKPPDIRGTGDPNSSTTGKNGWWMIVDDTTKQPITTRTISTSGRLTVVDSEGHTYQWPAVESKSYGALICRIAAQLEKNGVEKYPLTPIVQYSPHVVITKETSTQTAGQKLWREWTKGIIGNGTEDFFKVGGASDVSVKFEIKGEETYITLSRSGGTGSSAIVASSISDLMDEEQVRVTEADGKSYTTTTNYSVIIDATVDNTAGGYGILLNGGSVGHTNTTFKDCGYVLQYDRALDGFPIRMYSDGAYDEYADTHELGATIETLGSFKSNTANNRISSTEKTSFPGNIGIYANTYRTSYLKNSIMNFDAYNSYPNNANPMAGRKRIIITILEYYEDGHPEYPRFIIRLRFLKNHSGVTYTAAEEEKDPWHIGPKFYYSEPAWYGDFTGDAPNITANNRYDYTSKNYSDYSGLKSYFSGSNPGGSHSRYVTRGYRGTNRESLWVTSSYYFAGIFNAKTMNVRNDIQINKNISNQVFNDPSRKRYLGLRIWGTSDTATKFYSVNYAPGFRKEELQAIMPSGGKMYEVTQTHENVPTGIVQSDLNKSLFGNNMKSSGNGNGVMSIQHIMNGCTCPLCKYYQ